MKHLLKILALTFAFASFVHAGDSPKRQEVTYEGEVAGVMCVACSNHVQAALKKLPGVEKVSILPGKNPGLNKLVIVATSKDITLDAANKALGGDARAYNVVSLASAKP